MPRLPHPQDHDPGHAAHHGLGAQWRAGSPSRSRLAPLVALTTDVADAAVPPAPPKLRAVAAMTYVQAIQKAGGVPVLLPPSIESIPQYARRFDAFVFTGGDDPRTEAFGEPTHPKATPLHPLRQAFELALLDELTHHPRTPILGVCLGMQLMALHAGGSLNQHMPDNLATADAHYKDAVHPIVPKPVESSLQSSPPNAKPKPFLIHPGNVTSHHRQAVRDAGRLDVLATSPDGVIEAIADPARVFYLGVQWHPERTADHDLGIGLFEQLIRFTME